MSPVIVYIALIAIVFFSVFYVFWYPVLRRRKIVGRDFPESWKNILKKRLPVYKKLTEPQRKNLQELILFFLEEKNFIGCAGIEIDDEIKLVVAGQACLLLLSRPTREYRDLRSIYIYPTTFRAVQEVRNEIGLVSRQARDLLGESWSNGKVVLAWDSVEKGIRDFTDGENVVLHEFAHQLDHESGVTNGAPLLYSKGAYKSWAFILGKEFERLRKPAVGKKSVIDNYGAQNPAEFFAVATETFFEEPEKMFELHQDLFLELKDYYRLDPRDWIKTK